MNAARSSTTSGEKLGFRSGKGLAPEEDPLVAADLDRRPSLYFFFFNF